MKKLFKFSFLLILAIGMMVPGWAQQTTVKWTATKNGAGLYRLEVFDLQYGRYGMVSFSPYKLALLKDGVYLTGEDALDELQKPIWGQESNQVFADVLPTLTPNVASPNLVISNYHPISELPTEEGFYILRKLYDPVYGGYMYTSAMPLESSPWWHLTGFEEWKKKDDPNYHLIPNPDYQDNETIRESERAEYLRIIKETFVLNGNYSFPSLPTDPTMKKVCWYIKYENNSAYDTLAYNSKNIDKKFWLASKDGGWIMLQRPVRPDEVSTGTYPKNIFESQFKAKMNVSISLVGEARVRKLLGL